MNVYATLDELKSVLFPAGVTDNLDDADLQRVLEAASVSIDEHCGRVFAKDATDQTKRYYPSGGAVELVDLVNVTSVKIDTSGDRTFATTLAPADYELRPLNEPRYQQIRTWVTSSHAFVDSELVQVIGRFGYVQPNGEPPAPVNLACLLLAERWFKRHEAPFGILQSVDLGQFSRISADDPDVLKLLEPYVHGRASPGSWVAA